MMGLYGLGIKSTLRVLRSNSDADPLGCLSYDLRAAFFASPRQSPNGSAADEVALVLHIQS